MRVFVSLVALALAGTVAHAAPCTPSAPPVSWSQAQAAVPATVPSDNKSIGPLTLIMVRHAEKPLTQDGLMIEDGNLGPVGVKRAQRLPQRLLALYGCPDMIVSTNPAVKIHGKGGDTTMFNYIRPLATIAPYSGTIGFPVWTPYGFNEPQKLAQDLLGDKAFAPKPDGSPKRIVIAWEHHNIVAMANAVFKLGGFTPITGTMKNGSKVWTCETPPAWPECDFDSVWVVNIKDGQACLTRQYERLNNTSFQQACRGDVR